ncbi:hypothetical protein SK128_017197, partial [Halocaridina rubra]
PPYPYPPTSRPPKRIRRPFELRQNTLRKMPPPPPVRLSSDGTQRFPSPKPNVNSNGSTQDGGPQITVWAINGDLISAYSRCRFIIQILIKPD